MPAKPVQIGSFHFAKKGDADEYFRTMLYKYELGDKVNEHDAKLLILLISNHDEAKDKIGGGIESFSVRSADFGTRCFWVNRLDGTTEKFSFKACY